MPAMFTNNFWKTVERRDQLLSARAEVGTLRDLDTDNSSENDDLIDSHDDLREPYDESMDSHDDLADMNNDCGDLNDIDESDSTHVSEDSDDGGDSESIDSFEDFFEDFSVASFESGDELPLQRDEGIPNVSNTTDIENVYKKLDYENTQIRILKLYPASIKRADIQCILEIVTLEQDSDNNPIYEALSYTWGDSFEKREIFLNGHKFQVTLNLDTALRYLRLCDEIRWLWVDAVCINQNDPDEKQMQIGKMVNIYREASQILVWLGHSDKDIRKAMYFLEEVNDYVEKTTRKERIVQKVSKILRKSGYKSGLRKLFNKPWWSRVWVVQEVVVAKEPPLVGCGHVWIDFSAVQTAMIGLAFNSNIATHLSLAGNAVNHLALAVNSFKDDSKRETRSLDRLLIATSDRGASEARNKIFALSGIVADDRWAAAMPDYNEPCEMVFQKTMVYLLKEATNSNFLIHSLNQKTMGVPSWCVDFSHPDWAQYSNRLPWPNGTVMEMASGLPKSNINHYVKEGMLEIQGSTIGCIKHTEVSSCAGLGFTNKNSAEMFEESSKERIEILFLLMAFNAINDAKRFHAIVNEAFKLRFEEQQVVEMIAAGDIWKMLNSGHSLPLGPTASELNDEADLPRDYSELQSFSDWAFLPFSNETDALLPWSFDYWQRMIYIIFHIARSSLIGHTLFTTKNGYIGNAPTAVSAIKKGDIVCILHGCSVAAILRQCGDAYRIVTFTYIADLMEDELSDVLEDCTQTFRLC